MERSPHHPPCELSLESLENMTERRQFDLEVLPPRGEEDMMSIAAYECDECTKGRLGWHLRKEGDGDLREASIVAKPRLESHESLP